MLIVKTSGHGELVARPDPNSALPVASDAFTNHDKLD